MKRFFMMAAAAIGLATAMTSCSSDEPMNPTKDDGIVSFNVKLPAMADIRTKADDESNLLHFGDASMIDKMKCYVYNRENGDEAEPVDVIDIPVTETDGVKGGTINLRLPKSQYFDLVFYAYADKQHNTTYYPQYRILSYSNFDSMNNENQDCFYSVLKNVSSETEDSPVVMKRPFAQLNLGTADLEIFNTYSTKPYMNAQVRVLLYDSFNIMKDAPCGNKEEYVYSTSDSGESYYQDILDNRKFPVDGYKHLGMVYLFAGDSQQKVNLEVTYMTPNYWQNIVVNYNDIPLQKNYQTNIYGNLLTDPHSYNVSVNPIFESSTKNLISDYDVEMTYEDSAEMIINGTTYDLTQYSDGKGKIHFNIDDLKLSGPITSLSFTGNIKSIDVLNFDTSHIDDWTTTFDDINSLEFADLSKFNITNFRGFDNMFVSCPNLKYIKFSKLDYSVSSEEFTFGPTSRCGNLTTIEAEFSIIKSGSFKAEPLDNATAMRIINGLADFSQEETQIPHKIIFSEETYDNLTPEQIKEASDKGWTLQKNGLLTE